MKKIFLPVIISFLWINASAQKVTVITSAEELGNGYNTAFNVLVPHSTEKAVERKWVDFLKDNNGKVKSNKKGINAANALIKSICRDTLQVYSKIAETSEGILLSAAFSKNGTFIAPTTFDVESKMIDKILYELMLPLAKEGLKDKIKDATKILNGKISDNEDLEKRNDRLTSENEKMKSQISDNEREIKDNQNKIADLKAAIENQKNTLESIKSKEKDLE